MKKTVSLLIAILLMLGVCMFSAVAFAAEDDAAETRTVTFNAEEFAKLSAANPKKVQALNSAYVLDADWLKDAATVNAVFEGANYVLDTEAEGDYAVTSESDTVKLQYLQPGNDYKDDSKWKSATLGNTLDVDTTGWWGFRYALYLNGTTASYAAKSSIVYVYFSDNKAPVFSSFSTAMQNTQTNGVKVGSTYAIRNDFSVTDDGTTTITYVVYKKVNGLWTLDPIYDSTTKEVAEGYESSISSAGVITMQASDVLPDNEPVYKIVYTLTDDMGYVTTTKTDGTEIAMTIFATQDETSTDWTQVLKIVLYCVAGVALVGIIVVLCVKPKQKKDDEAPINKPEE